MVLNNGVLHLAQTFLHAYIHENNMLLDIAICVSYLLIVFVLGLWFSKDQHDQEDYFVAGRKMHWLPIGLSIFAGTFSALSFVGLPREAAYEDYQFFIAILFIPFIVMPLVSRYFLPIYFRLQVVSCYEYLERRFHRSLRLSASALYMAYSIGWMGNMLVAVGKILQEVMKLNESQLQGMLIAVGLFATFYTALGGVKAVIWTDALQSFALGVGMLIVLLMGIAQIQGGWSSLVEICQNDEKFRLVTLPTNGEDFIQKTNYYAICATGFFVYLAGHAVHFTAVQRYVSMPDIQTARKSLIVNGMMIGVVCLIFFLVGSMLFAWYTQTGDATFQQLHEEGKGDQLLPRFIITVIPQFGLTGLLLAGLFAAAMSSLDGGINSLTACVVCDWYSDRELNVWMSRILVAIFGLLTIAAAIVLQHFGGDVFRVLMKIAGSFLGMILGIFLLGMFSPRTNTYGAWAGLLTGLLCVLAVMFHSPWTESSVNVSEFWYGAISCIPVLVVGMLVSFFFPEPKPEQKLLTWRNVVQSGQKV